jgi:3-hydroxybutyrate dehydrogenase
VGGVLEGRVALVTAGSRGIGRAIVEGFLDAGASVAFTGRSDDKGRRALDELAGRGRSHFIRADSREQPAVEGAVRSTVSEFGRLDILVNNAGGSDGFALVADLTDEAWSNAMDLNINTAFWATRAALPHLVSSGQGRVINISSVDGKLGNKPAIAHYSTGKHALNGFTKVVAAEYGRDGVTSNAICPGAIETDLMQEAGPGFAAENGTTYEAVKAMYASAAAIGRLNTVDEVAAMATLLASPVGGGITGALLNVDGGTVPY